MAVENIFETPVDIGAEVREGLDQTPIAECTGGLYSTYISVYEPTRGCDPDETCA